MRIRIGRGGKKMKVSAEERHVLETIRGETSSFMTAKEVEDKIKDIEKDRERSRIWHGLTTHQKIRVLRAVAEKRKAEKAKKKRFLHF